MKKFIIGLTAGTTIGFILATVSDVYAVIWKGVDLTKAIKECFYGGYELGETVNKWNRKYSEPKKARHTM